MAAPLHVSFHAGTSGIWRIDRIEAVAGVALPHAQRLDVIDRAGMTETPRPAWILRGVTGSMRYTTRGEADALAAVQQGLRRPQVTRAALIPIRKSDAWWVLAQDERRAIFEEGSRHIAIGMDYLPAISRRLHHSRELGEPFDFLTWFEFAPDNEGDFDAMLRRLRGTQEWRYVEHEVDVRLSLAP